MQYPSFYRCTFGALLSFYSIFLAVSFAAADEIEEIIKQPDSSNLFIEDEDVDKRRKAEIDALRQRESEIQGYRTLGQSLPFDINAPTLRYDTSNQKIIADGGLTFSYQTATAEADSAVIDVNNSEAALEGSVRVTDVRSEVRADKMLLNFKTGQADIENAYIRLEPGGYQVVTDRARHLGNQVYELGKTNLTTCNCSDDTTRLPWHISADRANIVREGYAETWETTFYAYDVPVFYLPYAVFPVMSERQSGLLPFSFGYGSRNGFEMKAPYYWAIDRSTDMTITGILETETRYGADLEFRKILSTQHEHESGFLFVDETARDGELRGTNVSDLSDPTIDQDRYAGFLDHSWFGTVGEENDVQLVIDGNYISDDLILRELSTEKIAEDQARFVDSVAAANISVFETYTVGATAEYTQAIVDDDDVIFQRLPSFYASGFSKFKPFGQSPYGLKLTLNNSLNATNFSRVAGYDGWKSEAYEQVKFLTYYRNYFAAEFSGDARASAYTLDREGTDPEGTVLPNNSDRIVPGFETKVSTAVDRVFDVADDSMLREILDVGLTGRDQRVQRVKHIVSPYVRYRRVPNVYQLDNPQFDNYDQLAERNFIAYGVSQVLYARYEPRNQFLYGIEEATPEVKDMGSLATQGPLDQDLAFGYGGETGEFQKIERGSVVEVARFTLEQSYDLTDQFVGNELSDVAADFSFFPNQYFKTRVGTDFDVEETSFSSYRVEGQFGDKRGNEIRSRLRFVEDGLRQLETSAQVSVTDFIKLGYYSRYDDFSSKFIDNRAGLRFISSCKCWVFDVSVSDETNPNETSVNFSVTLLGLGNVTNRLFSFIDDEERQL